MATRAGRASIVSLALLSAACDLHESCPTLDGSPCRGADGCLGLVRCMGATAHNPVCECPPSEATEPEATQTELAPPAPGPPLVLGATCDADEDCPEQATCLKEGGHELFGGGPPRGICVAECTGSPEKCERFLDTVCVIGGEESKSSRAYCFPSCSPGVQQSDKCGARTDLACERVSADSNAGFCRPFCTRNEECTPSFCDQRLGVCSTSASSDLDLGQPCSPNSEQSGCSGVCLDLGGGFAVCSHRCSYGSTAPCTGSGDAPGYCLFGAPGGSLGDVGYCAQVCDCNDTCGHPQAVCDAFTSNGVRDLLGASGVCAPTDEGVTDLACTD